MGLRIECIRIWFLVSFWGTVFIVLLVRLTVKDNLTSPKIAMGIIVTFNYSLQSTRGKCYFNSYYML